MASYCFILELTKTFHTSGLTFMNGRVKPFEFDTGISGRKPPIDSGLSLVTHGLPKRNATFAGSVVGNTRVKALTSQPPPLKFRHIEPRTMVGRGVHGQAVRQALGFGRCKGFVQGAA